MRKNLINAILALFLVPATAALVIHRLPRPSTDVLAFPKATHRVAMAVEEAMKAELTSVVHGKRDISFPVSVGPKPVKTMQYVLPEDNQGFWYFPIPAGAPGAPSKVVPQFAILDEMVLEAKTRDGRDVHVTIKTDPFGKGSLVDCDGDEALARALTGRIADRLAHPIHKHESPEDRAALIAFFGGKPPAGNAPAGKLDPAVQRASGSDDLDPEGEDQ